MKYKVVFIDLGWYEVEAKSRTEAEETALFAARSFRPVDANELLKQSIYCKGEDGSMLYAVPISCIFAAPTLKPEETKNKEAAHE